MEPVLGSTWRRRPWRRFARSPTEGNKASRGFRKRHEDEWDFGLGIGLPLGGSEPRDSSVLCLYRYILYIIYYLCSRRAAVTGGSLCAYSRTVALKLAIWAPCQVIAALTRRSIGCDRHTTSDSRFTSASDRFFASWTRESQLQVAAIITHTHLRPRESANISETKKCVTSVYKCLQFQVLSRLKAKTKMQIIPMFLLACRRNYTHRTSKFHFYRKWLRKFGPLKLCVSSQK